ncbi:MAG: AmmeMemoRadiSam system protein A [Syntrophaceae bacterium]|jgi:AmmeMemoRadiSam system protein A|nr:AmmeMemoRadiSam system protein A [Syntrophaceae bacterium]HOC59404.1 AmmeMemoRadiSam system protein A [Smithellaceae bacterium]HQM42184.1 AmmeMemoRadiSam system protein A [Smithellaceae bacterium]
MDLTDQERKTLLDIARRAVIAKLGNKELPRITSDLPLLKEKRGAFVTLKKRGHLRGCIGYIKAAKSLGDTVQEMAVAAAFHDPRFPSVKGEEIRDLSFEISVLSPLKKIQNYSDIEIGKHGLFLVRGHNSGLLLPQVAVENGWNRDTFLKETCYKAGLPARAWKDKETEIYIFSADYFRDRD